MKQRIYLQNQNHQEPSHQIPKHDSQPQKNHNPTDKLVWIVPTITNPLIRWELVLNERETIIVGFNSPLETQARLESTPTYNKYKQAMESQNGELAIVFRYEYV